MLSHEEIERRLTQTETMLQTTRRELHTLTEIDTRASRRLKITHVGTAVMVAMALIAGRTMTTDAQGPQRVRAPFEVIGKNGRPFIRMVEPGTDGLAGGIYIYNDAGKIASMIGFGGGTPAGRVAIYKGDSDAGTVRAQATLIFSDHPKLIIQTSSKTEAGIVATPRALHLNNLGGHAAVSLNIQEDGSGQVELGDSNGTTVVDAKVLPTSGVGAVVTGPAFGGAMGLQGLPWAIVGKKSR
jgi:hypothetical protein